MISFNDHKLSSIDGESNYINPSSFLSRTQGCQYIRSVLNKNENYDEESNLDKISNGNDDTNDVDSSRKSLIEKIGAAEQDLKTKIKKREKRRETKKRGGEESIANESKPKSRKVARVTKNSTDSELR